MPRKPQGLRPISESVRKIIEKIKKEREERQGKDKSIRTQPKLPGMKKGGRVPSGRLKKDDREKSKGFERKFPNRPASPNNPVEVYEVKKGGLIGGQKKLDANKDGQISGEDFKILKAKKNKMKGGGIAIRGTNFKGVY